MPSGSNSVDVNFKLVALWKLKAHDSQLRVTGCQRHQLISLVPTSAQSLLVPSARRLVGAERRQ